jgi:hypothetical protein
MFFEYRVPGSNETFIQHVPFSSVVPQHPYAAWKAAWSAQGNLLACFHETDVKPFWILPAMPNKMFSQVAW